MRATSLGISVLVAGASGGLSGCAATGRDAVQRETIEWCNMWVAKANQDDLPRVLFVGDSITQACFESVEARLAGKAYCARITTSKCIGDPGLLPEVELLLKQYRFKVIHVNNGMHGWSYSEEQYGRAFEPFMNAIRNQAGGARVIWANTTPVMAGGRLDQDRTPRVRMRNRTAEMYATQHDIPINDLFGLVVAHPEYYAADGVHLNTPGIEAQAEQVADYVLRALEDRQFPRSGCGDQRVAIRLPGAAWPPVSSCVLTYKEIGG